MTTPELPGAGSPETMPNHFQQPPSPQQGYGAPTQMPPFQPVKPAKPAKQRNVVGLIALITAVIGFIFACIPGALIVGWILLPIAFILALVSLFLKDKVKWMGVTALIVSVIGTIVGVMVFISAVATSIDDAFGAGDTTVVQPANSAAPKDSGTKEKPATQTGTRENPSPIGSVIESDDWRVVINSVTLAATDTVMAANEFNEAPPEGSDYILVNYSATYLGDDPNGQMPAFASIDYVTVDGNTVSGLDSFAVPADQIDTLSVLYKDGAATGNTVLTAPTATADQGVLAVRAGMLGDKVFIAVK